MTDNFNFSEITQKVLSNEEKLEQIDRLLEKHDEKYKKREEEELRLEEEREKHPLTRFVNNPVGLIREFLKGVWNTPRAFLECAFPIEFKNADEMLEKTKADNPTQSVILKRLGLAYDETITPERVELYFKWFVKGIKDAESTYGVKPQKLSIRSLEEKNIVQLFEQGLFRKECTSSGQCSHTTKTISTFVLNIIEFSKEREEIEEEAIIFEEKPNTFSGSYIPYDTAYHEMVHLAEDNKVNDGTPYPNLKERKKDFDSYWNHPFEKNARHKAKLATDKMYENELQNHFTNHTR